METLTPEDINEKMDMLMGRFSHEPPAPYWVQMVEHEKSPWVELLIIIQEVFRPTTEYLANEVQKLDLHGSMQFGPYPIEIAEQKLIDCRARLDQLSYGDYSLSLHRG